MGLIIFINLMEILLTDLCLIFTIKHVYNNNKPWKNLYIAEAILMLIFLFLVIVAFKLINQGGWDQLVGSVFLIYTLPNTINIFFVIIATIILNNKKSKKT